MMNDSVNDRDGDITIKEELSPLGEFLVRRQDDRSVFISKTADPSIQQETLLELTWKIIRN